MIEIRKHLVPQSIMNKVTSGIGNGRKWITIHETDNVRKTANANAHARLQATGNSRAASWHWTVDDKEAVQSFNHTIKCWAAGDGSGDGNSNSIHIEICVNQDGNYKKAVGNTAYLVAKIMKDEKISISNVVQHNHWSGKNCPSKMRGGKSGYTWAKFLKLISKIKITTVSKPVEKDPTTKGTFKIQVLANSLNYYDSPRWIRPTGTVKKGMKLTAEKTVVVEGSAMYKTINGTYVSADSKYVKKL
ncbi:N-acetylmuramoyl-L-alanine amidase [Viridibacillus sp. YIM B01967]|uniref:N-acetylmuramoyl-L-alanine amidase n=1 Tax=Viridibacillus soli TaxID=2798301 RepID=A0ABS1H6H0_9BACL|nr:N-acetylmuramoyl-L-alanine amidase [Viridibacillus soli]MBK3494985.1 N-acetylmuramoyl-L-alanine amidase [Viridibacillus soli]